MGHLKVSVKLFSMVGITSLVALLIGIGGYWSIHEAGLALSGVVDTTLPCVIGLGQVREGLLIAQSAERTILVPELANSKEFERQRAHLQQALARIDAGMVQVEALPRLDADDAAQWKAFIRALGQWRKTNAQFMTYIGQKKRSNALTLSIGTSMISMRQAAAALDTMLKRNREAAGAMVARALTQAKTRAVVLLVVAAVALLAAVVLCVGVTLSIVRPLKRGVLFAQAVADGNLDARFDIVRRDEIGELADALRRMLAALREHIAEAKRQSGQAEAEAHKCKLATAEAESLRQSAETARREGMLLAADKLTRVVGILTDASTALGQHISQATQGASEQSERLAGTVTSMGQMSSAVLDVAKSAAQAADTAASARDKAIQGEDVVQRAVEGIVQAREKALSLRQDMADLGGRAESIGRILGVISDIADQTNLLALNAAIEAARAGEAGRGFAVVADEVRKLAEKTMAATSEVGQAVRGIQEGTQKSAVGVQHAVTVIEAATDLANESGQALEAIVALVEAASDQVRAIAAASEQQSSASETIEAAIVAVNQVSQETAHAMGRSASAVTDLADQTHVLQGLIETWRDAGAKQALPAA